MSWLRKIFGGSAEEEPAHPPLPANIDRFLPGGQAFAFRASDTAFGQHPRTGTPVFRTGTGSSLVSQADAKRVARENAQRNLATALGDARGGPDSYAYTVDRQLEPIVETLSVPGTPAAAQITINSYGALIVNARSALFVDVDTRRADDSPDDAVANDLAATNLRLVIERTPELGFRVYRTRNGWRYLCTSRSFDPLANETRQLLQALGADEKYTLLCRAQRCFRARLTPKPWRIGYDFVEVQPAAVVTRQRLERYLKKASLYASANFTAEVGFRRAPALELQVVIDYHDRWCGVHSGKPLA